jgi:hypothetical protein
MVERERTSSFHRGISLGSDSENARFYTGFAYLQRVLAGVRFFTLTLLELSDPGFLFSHRALLRVLAFLGPSSAGAKGRSPRRASSGSNSAFTIAGGLALSCCRSTRCIPHLFCRQDQRYSAYPVIVEICNTPQNIPTRRVSGVCPTTRPEQAVGTGRR